MSPYRASAAVVVRKLARLFPMSRDDVLDTVEDMGTLARRCKMLYHHVWWSETNEDARVQRAYATIIDRVLPADPPCEGMLCPVCDSFSALCGNASWAMRPIAQVSVPMAAPLGSAPLVMSPSIQARSWPSEIEDSRFEKDRRRRHIRCDGCRLWYCGNAVGTFWWRRGMPSPESRGAAWARGEWDASWYCIPCCAKYWDCSDCEVRAFLGFSARQALKDKFKPTERRSRSNC